MSNKQRLDPVSYKEELQFDLEQSSTVFKSSLSIAMGTTKAPSSLILDSIDGFCHSLEVKTDFELATTSVPLVIANNNKRILDPNLGRSLDYPPGFPATTVACSFPHNISKSLVDKRIILYKTEICRTFEETGICKYGIKCQFAHHPNELRPAPRHPRYKTEICRTFWENGTCPYGKRCCFIHNESSPDDNQDGTCARLTTPALPCSFETIEGENFPAIDGPNMESKLLPRIGRFQSIPSPIFTSGNFSSESWSENNILKSIEGNFTFPSVPPSDSSRPLTHKKDGLVLLGDLFIDEELWSEEKRNHRHLSEDILRLVDQ